jgi:ABC-2 type transport system permease protein
MAINARKVRAIIKREYVEHIRKKAFWIFTILMPLLWVGMIGISILSTSRLAGKKKIAVVDQTGRVFGPLRDVVASSKDRDRFELVSRAPGPEGIAALEERLKKEIGAKDEREKIDAFIVVDADSLKRGKVEYWAASISDVMFQEILERDLNKALLQTRLADRGLSPDVIREVQETVSIEPKSTNPKSTVGFWISYIFMFFLFFTLIQYGMFNLRGVIEEKANRVVEIVISSVRPTELMLGKIVGIGCVGLTQYAIWSVLAMNMALLSGTGIAAMLPGGTIPTIPLSIVLYFVLYFLLGYFFFASVYTAIGAPFNTEQEAQQLAMIPTWLLVIPMMFWWGIVNNPNSTLATVFSFIPLMTPVVMFMRLTLIPVPGWQIALSIALMLASIVGMAWLAGKIYRVGILMYGKKPTVPEILRWMRRGESGAAPEPAVDPAKA